MPEVETDDARLVQLGLDGDRDAFGRLVARYQSGLCALAYSACGDITRSQDFMILAWFKNPNKSILNGKPTESV